MLGNEARLDGRSVGIAYREGLRGPHTLILVACLDETPPLNEALTLLPRLLVLHVCRIVRILARQGDLRGLPLDCDWHLLRRRLLRPLLLGLLRLSKRLAEVRSRLRRSRPGQLYVVTWDRWAGGAISHRVKDIDNVPSTCV